MSKDIVSKYYNILKKKLKQDIKFEFNLEDNFLVISKNINENVYENVYDKIIKNIDKNIEYTKNAENLNYCLITNCFIEKIVNGYECELIRNDNVKCKIETLNQDQINMVYINNNNDLEKRIPNKSFFGRFTKK